jgi:outer membrane protein
MKKLLLFVLATGLAFPTASFAQTSLKIGTVDMQRAFKEYNKTKDAEAKVNDAKTAAKKEFDDRAESYKKALDEINKLNQQFDSPALSGEAKAKMSKERDEKIASLKSLEREINDFRQTREQQLQAQAMRMRESIVQEITDVVLERVKSNGMDLVFDKSGQSTNYVPVVLYSRDSADFTADIITALNKKAAASEKTATSSTSPATNPAKLAASPAKPATKP